MAAEEIMTELSGKFQLEGRVLTEKRRELVRFLYEQTEAMDAVSLWLTLRTQGKKISIASVYMTINWLARRGYLKRSFDPEMHQYLYRVER